jgi:hypothetical protein
MGILEGWAISTIAAWAGGTVLTWVIGYILKAIPNEKIYTFVESFFHGVGKWSTLTISKKSKLWNKIVEPWVIDLIQNTVKAALDGLIRGLRSDND